MIWHSESPTAILEQLKTDATTGLTTFQASEKLHKYGKNKLDEAPPKTFFQRFLDQMKDTMIIILLIAAVLSVGMSIYHTYQGEPADWIEPVVIVAIVLLNAVLGVFQESKAEKALDALKSMAAPVSRVIRDGVLLMLPATELVPGDIVLMEAGDMVPADCRLLEASSFRCDEAALTGESLPTEKDVHAEVLDMAPLGDRLNMAYAGCAVSYGSAKAVVVETGMFTEMGKIAGMLSREDAGETPLQKRLAQLGHYLGYLALAICGIIFVVGLISGLSIADMFMTAVSLAVAAIPEGLPAIVTIVLALGVQRMVKHNAIIRRLPAVETLGSASVICTDKTGTLTQNRMTLKKAYVGGRLVELGSENADGVTPLIRMAALCTDGEVREENGQLLAFGDPTETAILAYAYQLGMPKDMLMVDYPRLLEMPFDSDRKMMSTVHMVNDRRLVVVKGAPEILADRCVSGVEEGIWQAYDAMGQDALRVLAVGYKYIDDLPMDCTPEDLESGLQFAGLLGMIDPPRPEAMRAIAECKSAGILTVMITGDHIRTATAIARQLGILENDDEAITGEQLAALTDDELFENIRQYRVYARVTPSDKLRIVKAWQRDGQVVAMTGDGVNDAPALKAADIGCAMGITGTDVAKGAADMTLTDDNFATIVTAVKEGRGIYENIRKAVHFLLSCNLGEILTVFFAMLIWGQSPLSAVQLLWINLVTDSLPALALGMEPAEAGIMNMPPRSKKESFFARGLGLEVVLQGALIGLLTLVAYGIGGPTVAFATLAFTQMVHAFSARSHRSLFVIGLHTNWYMVGAVIVSIALMLAVLLIPGLHGLFGITPLSGDAWGQVGLLTGIMLAAVETRKGIGAILRRNKKKDE